MKKEKLTRMRKQRGLSQEQMAEYLNMDTSSYSRREQGKTKIPTEEWEKIAEVLEVPIEDIFEENTGNFIVNHGEHSGYYSGNNNIFNGIDKKVIDKLMSYIELLEEKIEKLQA